MKVLVLAGGFDQIELINEIKRRGNTVILADYFENPPAKKYADKHHAISTLDEKAIYDLAKQEKVDLLTTACTDQALLTVANVSEKLGLPCYIDSQTARNVTDKVFMKKKFMEYNIPSAECITLVGEKELSVELKKKIKYPAIVKPCDCNSSKGVVKVQNDIELDTAIGNAYEMSRSKKVVVEKYIDGKEISIDVWKDSLGTHILAVTETRKIANNENAFTIYKSVYPVEMSEKMIGQIENIANNICKAFDLDNCPILIQAIYDGKDVYVIEFSARMGGGTKYKLIQYISGINIMNVYVNRVLGDIDQIVIPKYSKEFIEMEYLYAHNGTFANLVGFDKMINDKTIEEYYVYKPFGSVIEKHTTSSDRIVGFLIKDCKYEALKEKRNRVFNSTDILDTYGNSIMFKEYGE